MPAIRYLRNWKAPRPQLGLFAAIAAVALTIVVSASLIGAQTSKTVRIVEPGAGGAAIDLSSFSAAAASLGQDTINVQWPNAAGLGSNAITAASVTVDQAQRAIVVEGNITVGGDSFRALFIADWAADVSTPTLSLTLDGNLDLSSLNSSWRAPTGAVVIDGRAIIATGDQNVANIAGTALLAGTATISQGLEVSGTVAVADVLPGAAAAGASVSVTGTLDADIVALLTTANLVPADPASAKLVGLLSGAQMQLPGASAISASDFAFVIGVEGSGAQSQLSVSLVGSIEVDHPKFSSGPVTFEAVALTDGTTTTISGGIKPGSTWRNPLGINGVVVQNAKVQLRTTTDGPTVGSFSGTMKVGAKTFSIDVESDGTELSLDLKLPRLSVGEVVDVMKSAGVSVGSVNSTLRGLTLEPTDLSFSTDAGNLSGALSTGATFRGQTVKVLIAGDSSGSNNLLVALSLSGGGTIGSFLDSAPALAAIPIPEGGIVVSRVPFNNLAFSPTSIEGAFLTDMFCGAAATGTCTYSVPSGVSFAARAQLPPTILDVLKTFGPIGTDGALRITGRIPVFGGGSLDLAVELPAITANANSPEWFDRATLKVEISIEDGSIGFGLVGQMTVNMPDPSDANPDKTQKVSFSIDATIEATAGSVSFTIGGGLTPGTGWDTPFGIDWLDLQALRLEISVTVGPNSSVQVGVRAKVRVGPSTFDGSFAIGFKPAGGLSFGFRVAADAIELRDLASLAAKMADSPGAFDPSSVPNASLRNVELSFSTIDAPNLCLEEGVKLSADLYLDSPMSSKGAGGEEPIDACGGQRSGTAANAVCLADEACFARVAFSLSEDGVTASAALNSLDLGAISVSEVQIALELTTSKQAFSASGKLSIPGFVDVNGSVEISTNGFAFVVSVKEDPNTGANPEDLDEFTISASASFGTDGKPPEFHFNMFVRMPSVDDILVGAQKTALDVVEFFVGKENAPQYVLSMRCLEVSVDVAASSTDVLSGDLKFNLHFAVVHRTDDSRSVGKVLALQWKFGESAVSNINNVATALTSPLPPDLTGCRIPPKSASFSNIILSINDAPIVYAGDLSETLPATFGQPVNVESTWTVTDPALYEVTIDLGQGRDYVEVWQHTRITEATKTVRIPPNLRYDADGAGVDDDGVGRFVITATLRVAGKDTPLKTLQLPVVVSDGSTVGHRINLPDTPSGNVFEGDRPAVSSTFTLRAGETKARSWFEVRVGDDGATFRVGGQDVSDLKFGQRTHNVAYDPRTWPNTGTITTERFALPVLRWDSETEQTILTHVVEYGSGAGAIRDRTSFVLNVQDDTPYFTQICSEDLCLDRDGSGPLLVASPDTRMLVGLIDPGLIEGSRDGITRANLREQVDNPYIVTMDGGIAGGLSLFGGEDLFRLASGRLSGLSYRYDLSRPELRDYEPGIHWVSWGVGCWSCPGTTTIVAPLLVVENNDEWKPNRASIPEGRSGWYSTAIATFDKFEGACGAVNFVVRAGAQSEFIEFAVVDSARPFDLAAAKNRVKVTDRTFGTPSDLVVANGVASWTTVPNQKYYIGVTDDHDQGSGACKSNRPHFTSIFQVELTRQPAAPVNDAFSRRVVLETQDSPFGRLPFSSVDLTRATTGAFEAARIPSCWSDGAQNTVFYEYWIPGGKPDRPVLAEAIPFSDEFGVLPPDAQLAVYQLNDDDSVGPEVGCSNASSNPWVDDVWAADGLSAHPIVAFTAKSTERYVIVVDTEGPAGRVDVRVSLPGQLDPVGIAGDGVARLDTSQGLTKAETKGTLPCAPGSVTRVGAVAWRASTNAPVRVTTTGSAVLGVVKIGENGVADGWPDALGSAGTVNIACGAASAGGLELTPVQGQQYVFLLGTAGSADVEVTVATTGEAFELPVGSAAGNRAGYWMVDIDGRIYAFGDGQLIVPTGAKAPVTSPTVKVLENPSGVGLWVLEVNGTVHALGGAPHYGNVDTSALLAGEVPATMAATPGGKGYYVFTSKGRVLVFGDAVHHGDLVQLGLAEVLRGDIVDSSALTDGSGYYMVGSDGGIFAFGAAEFAGSIPQVVAGPLVSPVNGLVADPDGRGYWLVAGDGGVFAFDAPFVGSLPGVLPPGTQLASPVNGLVPFGDGYMMVAGDGGIFNFSSTEFLGSLGGQLIPSPIVGVAPVPR